MTSLTEPIDLSKWRLVPVEATTEMLIAGAAAVRDFYSEDGPYPRTKAMWRSALDASPPPPIDVQALVERNANLEEALRPFARMNPQTIFTDDPTNQCGFVAVPLANEDEPADFTGADLARVRALLSEAP